MLLYIFLTTYFVFVLMMAIQLEEEANINIYKSGYTIMESNMHSSVPAKVICLFSFFIMWGLTAFRSINIGNDTHVYIKYFFIFRKGIDKMRNFEIGYQYLNYLINKLSGDPHIFLIIIASIMYITIALYVIKFSTNILLSTVLFYACFFNIYMSMLRQGLAMIIVLYAYQLLKRNRELLAIILIFFATYFHQSAIIAIILIFRNVIKPKKSQVIFLVSICAIFSQFGLINMIVGIVFPKYELYFHGQYASSGWLAVAYQMLFGILLFCFCRFDNNDKECLEDSLEINNKNLLILNFTLLTTICAFGFSVNLFTRLSEYFLLIAIFEISEALQNYDIRTRKLIMIIIGSLSLMMFLIVLIYRPAWNHLYPYEFWK